MANYISPERWKQTAREGPQAAALRKEFIAQVEAQADDSRELLFTISTDGIDRAGDKIDQAGWQLDSYRRNPVVLWAHDYTDYPVAMSRQIWTEAGKLKSIAKFVPADNPATGKTAQGIYRLYKEGFMSATSVGFLPKKWAWAEDEDRRLGIDFMEQELLEYSLVPVPANAEALIEARSAGIDIEPIRAWARGILRAKDIKSVRDFEDFLRDSGGFSRNDAVMLASHGWTGIQRDSVDLVPFAELTQQLIDALR